MELMKAADTELTTLWKLLGAVFGVWLVSGAAIFFFVPDWSNRGLFGDMFGTVNSLFAGLAFAGVIYTIFLQRNELALQRKELVLTREQLTRSAGAQEKSEAALAKQVDTLQLTARLNALSAIIEHYGIKIKRENVAAKRAELEKRQVVYIDQLEGELEALVTQS